MKSLKCRSPRIVLWISLSYLLFILWSCNESSLVGADLVGGSQTEILTERLEVSMIQKVGLPILTYNPSTDRVNRAQVGRIHDQEFGLTEASLYMQFIPATNIPDTFSNHIIDSVVLVLSTSLADNYAFEVGRMAGLQIYRLSQAIDPLKSYTSDASFTTNENILAEGLYSTDSNSIRIPMPNLLGDELKQLVSASLDSDAYFVQEFPGLYIKADENFDGLIGLNPYTSKLAIYHRASATDTSSAEISLGITTRASSYSVAVPVYRFDYSESSIEQLLDGSEHDRMYVQGCGGVSIEALINDLHALPNCVVNRAELFLPLNTTISDYIPYSALSRIYLTYETLQGTRQFLPEYELSSLFAFSPFGVLDTLDGYVGYTFNLPIFTQHLLDGQIFDEKFRIQGVRVPDESTQRLTLGPANLSEACRRSILDVSGNVPTYLTISYTPL